MRLMTLVMGASMVREWSLAKLCLRRIEPPAESWIPEGSLSTSNFDEEGDGESVMRSKNTKFIRRRSSFEVDQISRVNRASSKGRRWYRDFRSKAYWRKVK